MNSHKIRIIIGFVVWAAMASALLLPLEDKNPLLWCVWVALLLDGILVAGMLWMFAEGDRKDYLTNWLFQKALHPGVVLSVIFSLFAGFLSWSGIWTMGPTLFGVVQIFLLGWTAIKLLVVGTAQDVIRKDIVQTQIDTNGWKTLRLEMDGIVAAASAERKKSLQPLQELFRYADPASNPMVSQQEESIRQQIAVLKYLLGDGDEEKITAQISQLEQSVKERNACLKAAKN